MPYGPADTSDSRESELGEQPHTLFLAWCPACNREAPYAAGDLVSFPGPRAGRARVSGRVSAFERINGAS